MWLPSGNLICCSCNGIVPTGSGLEKLAVNPLPRVSGIMFAVFSFLFSFFVPRPVPGSLSSLLHLHNRQRQPMPASMPGTLPNPTMPGSSAVLMPVSASFCWGLPHLKKYRKYADLSWWERKELLMDGELSWVPVCSKCLVVYPWGSCWLLHPSVLP